MAFINLLARGPSFLASTERIGYKMVAWIAQPAIRPTPAARNFAVRAAANLKPDAPVAAHPTPRTISFAGNAAPAWRFPVP